MKKQNVPPSTGMTNTAEVWNGRLAMLGFIALIELISGRALHFVGIL